MQDACSVRCQMEPLHPFTASMSYDLAQLASDTLLSSSTSRDKHALMMCRCVIPAGLEGQPS